MAILTIKPTTTVNNIINECFISKQYIPGQIKTEFSYQTGTKNEADTLTIEILEKLAEISAQDVISSLNQVFYSLGYLDSSIYFPGHTDVDFIKELAQFMRNCKIKEASYGYQDYGCIFLSNTVLDREVTNSPRLYAEIINMISPSESSLEIEIPSFVQSYLRKQSLVDQLQEGWLRAARDASSLADVYTSFQLYGPSVDEEYTFILDWAVKQGFVDVYKRAGIGSNNYEIVAGK